MSNKRISYKATVWCQLDLPDDADMDLVIKTAKKLKGHYNEAEEIITSLGFNMDWSMIDDTEEAMSMEENDDQSTLSIYEGDVLLYENDFEEVIESHVRMVIWSTNDFLEMALQMAGDDWDTVYDKTKFKEALDMMFDKHDANNGITFNDITYYLDNFCKYVK